MQISKKLKRPFDVKFKWNAKMQRWICPSCLIEVNSNCKAALTGSVEWDIAQDRSRKRRVGKDMERFILQVPQIMNNNIFFVYSNKSNELLDVEINDCDRCHLKER